MNMDRRDMYRQVLPVWNAVKLALKSRLGQRTHESWTGHLELVEVTDTVIFLGAPNGFARDRIEADFGRLVREIFAEKDERAIRFVVGTGAKVDIADVTKPADETDDLLADFEAAGQGSAKATEGQYTFDNFVVGASNELSFAVARRLAQSSDAQYNPVVFHGTNGVGKTHLLKAIKSHIEATQPNRRVKYLSSEAFVSGFVKSLRSPGRDGVDAFKDELRACDVLIIDDAHFIADKPSSQEELLHTLIAMMSAGRQVVLALDCAPHAIPKASDRLKSFLAGGLPCDIRAADFELRRRILDKLVASKCKSGQDIAIPVEARDHLAARINASPRELIGAFNKVMARADFLGVPLTLETIQSTLAEGAFASGMRPTVDRIQKVVAEYYAISVDDILSKSRRRSVARPRQIAMALAKEMTTKSYPDIGRRFHRDHTTVLHAAKKVPELCAEDPQISEDLERIKQLLKT